MRVSLICTVLNEEGSLANLLNSIVAQTRLPDEVIFVDGGSRDRTLEVLRSYQERLPLRILTAPGANISQGRNRAIEAASGEIIASTDAGVRLSPNWLADLLSALGDQSSPAVACGFFLADPSTNFEVAMGATVLPGVEEIDPASFLPSSRSVAFLRAVCLAVGGYPEWLDYCEDLVFDMKLKDSGCKFVWAPNAVARFRPRSGLVAFFRQYYRYARGDGKADLWRKRHAIRYSTYLAGLASLVAGSSQPWVWLLLAAGAAAYLYQPYRRLSRNAKSLPRTQRLITILWVPVIRLTGDVAKMLGYPVGVIWRWRFGEPAGKPVRAETR